jgi:glycosyltransferase involved in cell wall biosynthesis
MVAGIEYARGEILLTMDGDLQNDPADIPRFVATIQEGYDIVVGWRHQRRDKLITRKVPSKIANWLIGKVTGVPIKDNGCSLKAYRAGIVKNIPLYSEMHRFIPAMTSLAGTKIAEIKVNHHARRFGTSKYGLSRIYKVILDLLTIKTILSFFSRPLVAFALGSFLAAVVSLVALTAGVIQWLEQPGQPSIVFLGMALLYAGLAIVLVFWGILAELIYRTGDLKPASFAKLKIDTSGIRVMNRSSTNQ